MAADYTLVNILFWRAAAQKMMQICPECVTVPDFLAQIHAAWRALRYHCLLSILAV
jgi:hypothetical protein